MNTSNELVLKARIANINNRKSKFVSDVEERIAKRDLLTRIGFKVDCDTKGKKYNGTFDILMIRNVYDETLCDRDEIVEFLERMKREKSDEYFNNNKMLHSTKTQQFKKLVDIKINNKMSDILEMCGFDVEEKKMRKGAMYSAYYPFVTKRISFNGIVLYEKGKKYDCTIAQQLFGGEIMQTPSVGSQ